MCLSYHLALEFFSLFLQLHHLRGSLSLLLFELHQIISHGSTMLLKLLKLGLLLLSLPLDSINGSLQLVVLVIQLVNRLPQLFSAMRMLINTLLLLSPEPAEINNIAQELDDPLRFGFEQVIEAKIGDTALVEKTTRRAESRHHPHRVGEGLAVIELIGDCI